MEYTKLSILEIIELLKAKKLTSEELVKETFDIINKSKELNAFISVFEQDALSQARSYDKRRQSGEDLPILAGIPISIKDNINVKGYTTTCASKLLKNYVSPYNATIVTKLLDAGAIIIGKNNLDEFAMGNSTEFSSYGVTLNPCDRERVAGGSSGGSACAVASYQGCASIGTDTGGSIRQPSSYCGVVGLKPTYGTVSRYGVVAFASSLDQAGPITRTVKDNALIYSIISGYDRLDSTSVKHENVDYLYNMRKDVKGIKIGIIKELYNDKLDKTIIQNIDKCIELFKSNGASIVELSMPNIKHTLACYYVISSAEASSNLARFDGVRYGVRGEGYEGINDMYFKTRTQGFGAEVKRRIMLGNYVLSSGCFDAYYQKAKDVQKMIISDFDDLFKSVDVIISPTTLSGAFKVGEKIDDRVSMYLNDTYTAVANIAQLPAITVPCGKDNNNMPLGLQIIGKKFSEQTLFDVANFYEVNSKEVK